MENVKNESEERERSSAHDWEKASVAQDQLRKSRTVYLKAQFLWGQGASHSQRVASSIPANGSRMKSGRDMKILQPFHQSSTRTSSVNCTSWSKENGNAVRLNNAESIFPDKIVRAGSAILGEYHRKKIKRNERITQKLNIIGAVCALLNSGGGLVLVDVENTDYNYMRHRLGLDIEESLQDLTVCKSMDYYDIIQNGAQLRIFVKTWSAKNGLPRICSLGTGLYIRLLTNKIQVDPMMAMEIIDTKTKNKHSKGCFTEIQKFPTNDNLRKGETLNFSESEHVEFKDFSGKCKMHEISDAVPLYLSAFANADGGSLMIGIGDQGEVNGFTLTTDMSECVILMNQAKSKVKTVHFENCTTEENLSCEITFKNVHDEYDNCVSYVIIFTVKPFCCLAFADKPQSWIIESDYYLSQVKQLDPSAWTQMMSPNFSARTLESQFTEMSLSDRPFARPVYTMKELDSLKEIQQNLFGDIKNGITFKPDILWKELCNENPELNDLFQRQFLRKNGLLILSRSWAVDVGQKSHPNVICDALLIPANDYPTLYTLFSTQISQEEFEYSRQTAFTLKQKLVNIGGYTGKLCVIPEALTLNNENAPPPHFLWPEITYPPKYKLLSFSEVKEVVHSLLIVMLSFKSIMSDLVGIEFFNLLTTEQYRLLSKSLQKTRHLFVHGLPGTGKTVLALKIMEKIKNEFNCSTENILYICENQPLRDYVMKQNVCEPVTRKTFMSKKFPHIQHIIADEAQNFRTEDGDWYKKAEEIFKNAGDTSIFWVFMDHFQTSHSSQTGLPRIAEQNKESLDNVIRNPTKIYYFILEPMSQIANNSDPSIANFLREQVNASKCVHRVEGYCIQKTSLAADIVQYITKKCSRYLKNGYSERDIAILCNTKEAVDYYRPMIEAKMRKSRLLLQNASHILENVVIIDSVRRFSGLERCIVFVINPVSVQSEIMPNILVCAASRASMKLHVIYEI
ncbi:schlafen family member 9-like [Pelodytes ibericus]